MDPGINFVDMLKERRKQSDILWVSRNMKPLFPHKLPAESTYSRNDAIKAVLDNTKVKFIMTALAEAQNIPTSIVYKKALGMIAEMASKAHLPTVRWLGIVISKVLKRIFLSIYINETMVLNLKKEMQISQVQYVYVPSHRSYMDFILLSCLLFNYDMALPNIASGMDFYNMFIVGEILRKTGAFYMRRSFANDTLYKEIFRTYVSSLVTNNNRAIEFFIEGTRSRSQKSMVPKYGLLSTILESFHQSEVPDIHFVPISISYDRPPEELLFVYELLGVPKPKESTTGLFKALSILRKPQAHGCAFFNIGQPISAHEFVTNSQRKAKVLYPHLKLPSETVEHLAYAIVEAQKRNTVLTGFNLIATLFNERIQTYPNEPYTLDTLIMDYVWFKYFMKTTMHASVYPENKGKGSNDVKDEILFALKPHEDLIVFNLINELRLKQRHKQSQFDKPVNVKGHALDERTMCLAVPAIHIQICINPIMAFLAKPAILTLTVELNEIQLDEAFERYALLRTLLSTEFALPENIDSSVIKSEWEETLFILTNEHCLNSSDGKLYIGKNIKLYHLLHNVMLPFLDAAYITCVTLFEWDTTVLGNITTEKLLTETQKSVEEAIFQRKNYCRHPYCLSLDLFRTTLSNLISQEIVVLLKEEKSYIVNKVLLAQLIEKLQKIKLQRPLGSYIDIVYLSTIETPQLQAKL